MSGRPSSPVPTFEEARDGSHADTFEALASIREIAAHAREIAPEGPSTARALWHGAEALAILAREHCFRTQRALNRWHGDKAVPCPGAAAITGDVS